MVLNHHHLLNGKKEIMNSKTISHTEADRQVLVAKLGGSIYTDKEGKLNESSIEDLLGVIVNVGVERFFSLGLVIGGGPRARADQAEMEGASFRQKDKKAQKMMLMNAEGVRTIAGDLGLAVVSRVPKSPGEAKRFANRKKKNTVSLSWLKPGQSSDASAAYLLQYFLESSKNTQGKEAEANFMILTNVIRLCVEDPRKNPDTKPIKTSSVGTLVAEGVLSDRPEEFTPGMSVPIDMVAVHELLALERKGFKPRIHYGLAGDLEGVKDVLMGKQPKDGTTLHADNLKTVYYNKEKIAHRQAV